MKIGLNIGSGQRKFNTVPEDMAWVNVDCGSRPPDQVPDLICNVGMEPLPYDGGIIDMVVLHQVLEHMHLGPEMDQLLGECYRVLKPEGSLIITVPDMRALAARWLTGQIEDYIFMVNVYGAWQGYGGDDHHWGFSASSLHQLLETGQKWSKVHAFNWRPIAGADIARDWWILGMECVK